MTWLPRITLLAALAAGGMGLAPSAHALPAAAPALGTVAAGAEPLLQDVRYVNRCRPVVVHRRDRFGRPVRVRREQCRRVWVGGGPRRDRY